MISEDVECLRSHAACGHMEHAGEQLTGDLVHIGDHQEQTLRRGVGGGQRARTQRAVDGTCRARLGLHFHHLDGGAEDVLESLCGPLVHIVSHRAGGGNRVDACDLCERVAHCRGCLVTVHRHFFSVDNSHSW